MGRYRVVVYSKVKKFIEKLDRPRRAKIDRIFDLFEEYGPHLPTRYLKKVARDVWELRPGDIRLFLTIRRNKALIIHGIHKKSNKIPKKDLDLVIKRIKKEID
jgi:phage-related protein